MKAPQSLDRLSARDSGLVALLDPVPNRSRTIRAVLQQAGLSDICMTESVSGLPTSADLVLVALGMPPDLNGDVLSEIRRFHVAGTYVIAYEDGSTAWPIGIRCKALLAGARRLLDSSTPVFLEEIGHILDHELKQRAQQRSDNESLRRLFAAHGIVAESTAMAGVLRGVARLSRLSDVATLLLGETGTGKELFARALHSLDPKRVGGPFVAVNCAALPSALAESELFGFRSGTFTGAVRDRRGLFRAAHRGVIFLDEVGDLELPLQGKLLRVLQEGRILGLGEDLEVTVDVRVITATSQNLADMVRSGRFREDLYYRLHVAVLHIPPVRERRGDIGPLLDHFLQLHRALCSSRVEGVADEVLLALSQLKLPGNVRQLENLVRQALLDKDDDGPLRLSDLPLHVWQSLAETEPETSSPSPGLAHTLSAFPTAFLSVAAEDDRPEPVRATLSQTLQRVERLILQQTLQQTEGNQTKAAQLLGLTPRTVYSKLRKYRRLIGLMAMWACSENFPEAFFM